MLIYVIRHGETQANVDGVLQGQSNSPLLENGIDLARKTGRAISDVRFDAAFSSPLDRALETAKVVLAESGNADTSLIIDERLMEIAMGIYEGKRFRPGECEVDHDQVRLFFENPFAFEGFPRGESIRELCFRTQACLADIAAGPYETVLVSTHGTALRALLNKLYDDPSDFWQEHVPYNCAVSIVEATDGALTLRAKDRIYYERDLCVDRYATY